MPYALESHDKLPTPYSWEEPSPGASTSFYIFLSGLVSPPDILPVQRSTEWISSGGICPRVFSRSLFSVERSTVRSSP